MALSVIPSLLVRVIAASLLFHGGACATTKASVISVPPSQYWEGAGSGGTWSTFWLQIGTPVQNVRVLPATGGTSIWVVVPEGCIALYGADCKDHRGQLYMRNQSSTWSSVGIYDLNLFTEHGLGYYGNGLYGFEKINIGGQGAGLPTLTKQVVAGIAAKEFWLGAFPLSPWPVNFTTMNDPQDGLMTSLKKARKIDSLSYGYTAGANARSPQVYGSLTLGGYDTSQFKANNVKFHFGGDISRDLLVPVNRIHFSNNNVALSQTTYFFIDSLVPDLWLPDAACDVFEKAFSLKADNKTGLYLVSEILHQQLSGQNLSVTFTLGTDTTFQVTMPYFAFDMDADAPLVQNATRYFPLRRASDNSTQYTLGRAFLQAAYVIADYERGIFSIHQAIWPDSGTAQNLVPILSSNSTDNSDGGKGLGNGAIAGIVIGIVAVIAIIAIAYFRLRRKRRQQPPQKPSTPPQETADPYGLRREMDTHPDMVPPALAAARATTMPKPQAWFVEVDANESSIFEAPQSPAVMGEMDGDHPKNGPGPHTLHRDIYEMETGDVQASEMETPVRTPRGTTGVTSAQTPAPPALRPGIPRHLNTQNSPNDGIRARD